MKGVMLNMKLHVICYARNSVHWKQTKEVHNCWHARMHAHGLHTRVYFTGTSRMIQLLTYRLPQ